MKLNKLFLAFAALLVVSSSAEIEPSLRSGPSTTGSAKAENSNGRRNLFFRSLDLADVIDVFQPVLNRVIQSVLSSNLENVNLGVDLVQELANLELGPNCTTTASITYLLQRISGLDSFRIDAIELVPGSDNLDISFFGMNGVSWEGVWDIVGSFTRDIGIDALATLSADACGVALVETSSGVISAESPELSIRMVMDGSSPSLFNLRRSIANSVSLEDAKMTFDSIIPNIEGTFGNGLDLNLDIIFDGLFTDTLLDQLLPLILELLQNAFAGGLPF